jgi:hypothetical protein
VSAVAAVYVSRVTLRALVEKPLPGDVVVEAQNVGNARLLAKAGKLCFVRAGATQILVKRVSLVDASVEQVEAEKAPLVLEVCLVSQRGGAAHES